MEIHDDADREVRTRILRKFMRAQLEKSWPKIEERLNALAGAFDLTLAETKQASKLELDQFSEDKLDV